MKKIITLITVFVVISGAVYAQDQEPDFYTQQLDSQTTIEGIKRVVQTAFAEGVSDEFYVRALDKLVGFLPNISGASQQKDADDLGILLSAKLGEDQYAAGGPNLWKAVESYTNPLVRAEALASLGKAQAVDFIPQVVQLLSDINTDSGRDPMSREQVAYGAIIALEEYKDSSGYLPVFFVTVGWYTDRIKSRAREALPKIMDNPTEPLISVIKGSSYNFTAKYGALQVLEESDVTAQQKAQGAVAALSEAWRTNISQSSFRGTVINLRKLSLSMVRRYGTEDANVYPLLEKCYREGSDQEEQIAAIAALSALASDDSARILSGFLMDINTRQARGTLTQEDERMIRVIIPALGNTGRPGARNALRATLQADWTSTVLRLTQDALKQIP
jgi:hypothetical protein